MKKVMFVLLIALAAACSPGKMVGTGYHIVIEQRPRMAYVEKAATPAEADAYVFEKTGLVLKTDSLIGDEPPCYRFDNFEYDVYVEMKGIYQRREGGREKWRQLDEIPLTVKNN